MEFFRALVQSCDAFAFRALPDGRVPAGVAKEMEYAREKGMPVLELPSCVVRRTATLEETREYLREVGQAVSRPRVYLAGPITGLSHGVATDWRDVAAAALAPHGIDAFSPLRAKHWLKGEMSIDGSPGAYLRVHPLSAPKGICTRDRNDVAAADVVLMNLLGASRVSVGSMIEVGWADAARVPLVVVIEPFESEVRPPDGSATDVVSTPAAAANPHHHAMVAELAGYVVPDLERALEIVRALVLP